MPRIHKEIQQESVFNEYKTRTKKFQLTFKLGTLIIN